MTNLETGIGPEGFRYYSPGAPKDLRQDQHRNITTDPVAEGIVPF